MSFATFGTFISRLVTVASESTEHSWLCKMLSAWKLTWHALSWCTTLGLVLPLVNAMLTVDIPRQKWNLQLANLNSRQSKEVVGQLDQNYGIPLTINKLSTDLPQQSTSEMKFKTPIRDPPLNRELTPSGRTRTPAQKLSGPIVFAGKDVPTSPTHSTVQPLSLEEKNDHVLSANPFPHLVRTSSSKLREVPGTHWIKVHRNRQKLRLLAQTSSQDVKSPRCTLKEIASFWWNTVKPKTPEDKLLVAHMQDRPGKLKSVEDLAAGPSNGSSDSPESRQAIDQVSENVSLEHKRKASNLHQEMGIHINPGQDWGATSDKGLSPVVNEKSPESSQHPGESTSKNLIEATTPTNRRNARKKWREISVKVKALSALGILVEKGIEKADNLVVKADHWLEKLNTPITLIHNFLEGWNEFDEMLQILDVFLTSRRNHPNGELEVRP